MKFYRLVADPLATTRWHLRAPVDMSGEEVDPRLFTAGLVTKPTSQLRIPLRRAGDEVDFNFGDFDMVVSPAVINAELETLTGASIERIPVWVQASERNYEILNILKFVRCIDEATSEFTKWTTEDGRPDKTGVYRMFTRLQIQQEAANGNHLFRIAEWPIALIASAQAKAILERHGVTGVGFQAVT